MKRITLFSLFFLALLTTAGCRTSMDNARNAVEHFSCSRRDFATMDQELRPLIKKAVSGDANLIAQLTETGKAEVYDLLQSLNLKMAQECAAAILDRCQILHRKVNYSDVVVAGDRTKYKLLVGPVYSFGIRAITHTFYAYHRVMIEVDKLEIPFPKTFEDKMDCFLTSLTE